jgi:TonB family protein
MGKIVKYCAVCEEGFAEKFSFCPNCASSLTAFELNPVESGQAKVTGPLEPIPPVVNDTSKYFEVHPSAVSAAVPETFAEQIEPETPKFLFQDEPELLDLHSDAEEMIADEPQPTYINPVIPNESVSNFEQPYNQSNYQNDYQYSVTPTIPKTDYKDDKPLIIHNHDDGEFHTTIIEEKNNSTRQLLLLGAFVTVMFLTFGGVIVSLFTNSLFVGAINEDSVIAYLPGEAPDLIEEEKPKPKTKDDAGGGGGGGKKDPTPTSQGEFARQTKIPTVPPSADMQRVTNPEIKQVVATTGPENNEPPKDRYGNPKSNIQISSDGTGSGGGQGEGTGTGQGNGRGGGRGNGNGNGIGNGNGNGIGNGNGDGTQGRGGDDGPPPAKKPTVTTPLKILAKPKGLYTDAARQNQVQGTVRLRVVFNANGSIGSISVVSGLSNGLTEQAIAAARGIRFEPQQVNGQAQTVTKQIDYSFTLY